LHESHAEDTLRPFAMLQDPEGYNKAVRDFIDRQASVARRLESLRQAGLFQRFIGGVARFHAMIDGEMAL
jgi:hypothetical protein